MSNTVAGNIAPQPSPFGSSQASGNAMQISAPDGSYVSMQGCAMSTQDLDDLLAQMLTNQASFVRISGMTNYPSKAGYTSAAGILNLGSPVQVDGLPLDANGSSVRSNNDDANLNCDVNAGLNPGTVHGDVYVHFRVNNGDENKLIVMADYDGTDAGSDNDVDISAYATGGDSIQAWLTFEVAGVIFSQTDAAIFNL